MQRAKEAFFLGDTLFHKGQLVADEDDAVKKMPEFFETVEQPTATKKAAGTRKATR